MRSNKHQIQIKYTETLCWEFLPPQCHIAPELTLGPLHAGTQNASAELPRTKRPLFMSPALNSLRICLPGAIWNLHRSTQRRRTPSSKDFSPWTKGSFNSLSCPRACDTRAAFLITSPRVPEALKTWFSTTQVRPCQHIGHTRIKHEKCLQCLILQPSSRKHSWPDSSHPWKETCRNVLDSPSSASQFWVPTPCAAVSPTLPPPNIQHPFEGKVSCKDKKLHLQKLRRSALKNQTPKYIWTHE